MFNPIIAVTNVEDANRSTRLLSQTSLRNVLGRYCNFALLKNRTLYTGQQITLITHAGCLKYTLMNSKECLIDKIVQ